jgi:hypothetical protein
LKNYLKVKSPLTQASHSCAPSTPPSNCVNATICTQKLTARNRTCPELCAYARPLQKTGNHLFHIGDMDRIKQCHPLCHTQVSRSGGYGAGETHPRAGSRGDRKIQTSDLHLGMELRRGPIPRRKGSVLQTE